MAERSAFQRGYLILITLLGAASASAVLLVTPPPSHTTLLLAAACTLIVTGLDMLRVRMETSTPNSPVFVTITPAMFIFTLLIAGPIGLVALLAGTALARWLAQRWHQPLGYLFNAVDISVSYCALLALTRLLWRQGPQESGLAFLLGGLTLISACVALDLLYGGLLTSVGSRRPFVEVLRTIYAPTAWVGLIPLSLGVLGAALFVRSPWLLPFVIIPLALAYQALRSIAAWLAASQQLRSLNAELQAATQHLEQRVEERTADLLVANQALDRVQRNREQEVTNAAHDIDQILRTAVHVLSTDEAAPRSRRELVALLAPAMDVLEDMKLAARLRNNSLTLNPRPTDLVAVVAEAVAHIRPRYTHAGCRLEIELLDAVPPVWADGPRLRRVLLNLLENALIYSSHSPNAAVTLSVTVEGSQVLVAVRDNGVGIAPGDLQRIGERFFRVAQGTEQPEGSGIGLACSTRIVALSGGRLWLESAGLGCGTTVTLQLPLELSLERAVGEPVRQPVSV